MGVALITPFKEDESVDYDALMRMVDYLVQNNTDFLCVLGTTAETPTLTDDEKQKIKRMVIDRVAGRIPILLGVSGNNTRAVVDALRNDDYTGVDAVLSVVPYYNKPSQEGIYQHYRAIAQARPDMPIVLYNVPGRTGVNMTAETTLRIARDLDNVVAIKEASGNITQMHLPPHHPRGRGRHLRHRQRLPPRVQPHGAPRPPGRLCQRTDHTPQVCRAVQAALRGRQPRGRQGHAQRYGHGGEQAAPPPRAHAHHHLRGHAPHTQRAEHPVLKEREWAMQALAI